MTRVLEAPAASLKEPVPFAPDNMVCSCPASVLATTALSALSEICVSFHPTGRFGCAHQSFFPCRSQGTRRTWLHCGVFFNSRCCGSGWLRHLPAGNPGGPDEGNDWKSIRASNRCLGSTLERRRIRNH